MKIIFICGSLEPGCDGVGDYSRKLAGELVKNNCDVTALAWNDKSISGIRKENQISDGVEIPVLRFGMDTSIPSRLHCAQEWISKLDPDWVSLQYGPFAFHNKGLPWGLGDQLFKIGEGRSWHIMFHELWIGVSRISPLRHKILGFVQKRIARRLEYYLSPKLTTTSYSVYQSILRMGDIESQILPLFSNIPVVVNTEIRQQIWTQLGVDKNSRNHYLLTGIFGSIHPESDIENVLKKLLIKAKEQKLVLICFGRLGNFGEAEIKRLEELFKGIIIFKNFGEQPPEVISSILQVLDLGISCTPAQYLGKSGVFAAYMLHEVEVIPSSRETLPEFEDVVNSYLSYYITKRTEEWSVEWVAKEFIRLLEEAGDESLGLGKINKLYNPSLYNSLKTENFEN